MEHFKYSLKNGSSNLKKHLTKNPLKRFFLNRFIDLLLDAYQSLSPQKVLEVGCGEGIILHHIRIISKNTLITGIDINENAIRIAADLNPPIPFLIGDINQLPFPSNAFDLVICSEVLEHLHHPRTALKELCRISSKHLLLSVPNEPYFHLGNFFSFNHLKNFGHPSDHFQQWSTKTFKHFVSEEVSISSIYSPFPWTIIAGQVK